MTKTMTYGGVHITASRRGGLPVVVWALVPLAGAATVVWAAAAAVGAVAAVVAPWLWLVKLAAVLAVVGFVAYWTVDTVRSRRAGRRWRALQADRIARRAHRRGNRGLPAGTSRRLGLPAAAAAGSVVGGDEVEELEAARTVVRGTATRLDRVPVVPS